ncbi:MAG: TraR/DksA C4-type zinc finger protein, partial [bacterium]|nr:TraR/DksA C4-type zinc finger protein [bacterium]
MGIEELKKKLEREKENIEKQLEKFAFKDKKLKGDWDTRFPRFNGGETGSAALEQAADEVEEYSTLLSIEHSLELRLKNINSALEKIKKGKYGICEKCGKEIPIERLKAFPEARTCTKCQILKKVD